MRLLFHNHSFTLHYISNYLHYPPTQNTNRHHRPHSSHEARFSRNPFARHISDRIPASPEPEKRGSTHCLKRTRPAKRPRVSSPVPFALSVPALYHPRTRQHQHPPLLPLLHHAGPTLHPSTHLKPNISRRLRHGPYEPHLVHAWYNQPKRTYARPERCDPRRKPARRVPRGQVIRRPHASLSWYGIGWGAVCVVSPICCRIVPPKDEMLDHNYCYECRRPVPDDPQAAQPISSVNNAHLTTPRLTNRPTSPQTSSTRQSQVE